MAVTAGYIASQQKRYNDAIKANDKDLIGRLEADAKRANYTLTRPSTPAKAVTPTPAKTVAPSPTQAVTPKATTPSPQSLGSSLSDTVKSSIKEQVNSIMSATDAGNKNMTTEQKQNLFVPEVFTPKVQTQTQSQPSLAEAFNKLQTPTSTYSSSVAQGVYTPSTPAPVQTVAPTSLPSNSIFNTIPASVPTSVSKVETPAPMQVTTPAPTRPSLEQEAGQLSYTPTLDVFKQAATPKYTTDVLTAPQTELEKQAGLPAYTPTPITPVAQPTQTPLEQEAGITGTYTPPAVVPQVPTYKDFVEANKQSVVVPTDRVETPTLTPTVETPKVEEQPIVKATATVPTGAEVRKGIVGKPFSYPDYVNFVDSIASGEQLTPDEELYAQNARNEIFKSKDLIQQEMNRAQNKIMALKAQNLNADGQEKYYTTLATRLAELEKPVSTAIPEDVQNIMAGKDLAQEAVSGIVKGIEEGTGKQLGTDSSLVNAFPEGERQKEIALDTFLKNPNDQTWNSLQESKPDLATLTPDQKQAVDDFRDQKLSTPEGVQSEMDRAENVIMDMKADGLDTTAQERYMAKLKETYDSLVSGAGVQGQPLTVEQAEIQRQELKSAYERAIAEVDRANKAQTADLQAQGELATKAYEIGVKEQRQLFKEAMNNLKDNSFVEQLKAGQTFANRGLLNSGMFTDALVRLGMSANQKISDIVAKQITNLAGQEQKYQSTMQSIKDKQQRIVDGREADIEKAFKAIQKDTQTAVKTSQDAFIEQAKILYNTVKTLSSEGMNTQELNALFADGLQRGSFAGMIQYMGTQQMPLSTKGALDVARADKVYADQTGAVYVGGKPLLDPKGQAVQTMDARIAAQKIQLQQNKIAQDSANIRAKIGSNLSSAKLKVALEELKLEKKIGLEYDKLTQKAAEKNMQSVLDMIKQGDRDYIANMNVAVSLAQDEKAKVAKEKAYEAATAWAATRNQLESTLNMSKEQIENLVNSYGGSTVNMSPTQTTQTGGGASNFFIDQNQARNWLNTWMPGKQ
jgi:hypothetical protein